MTFTVRGCGLDGFEAGSSTPDLVAGSVTAAEKVQRIRRDVGRRGHWRAGRKIGPGRPTNAQRQGKRLVNLLSGFACGSTSPHFSAVATSGNPIYQEHPN